MLQKTLVSSTDVPEMHPLTPAEVSKKGGFSRHD
jgi:hypothetical protein